MRTIVTFALFTAASALPTPEHSTVILAQDGARCGLTSSEAWAGVDKTASGRVNKTAFVSFFQGTAFGQSVAAEYQEQYAGYLGRLHDLGYQMMPNGKTGDDVNTLGQHCFRTFVKPALEFYASGSDGFCDESASPPPSKISDDAKCDVSGAWAATTKTASGRVGKSAFIGYFKSSAFFQSVSSEYVQKFDDYLGALHEAGYAMMPNGKTGDDVNTLGGHCFRSMMYAAVEFYAAGNDGYCTSY